MSDKKPGFMDRLFGRPAQPPKPGHEPPPGPPETTPDYIERVEARQQPQGAETAAPKQSYCSG